MMSKSLYECDQGQIWDFLEGVGQIFKKKMVYFFLGRPSWFAELSEITKKLWKSFLRRTQSFEKTGQKAFLGKFSPKNRVFSVRAPPPPPKKNG